MTHVKAIRGASDGNIERMKFHALLYLFACDYHPFDTRAASFVWAFKWLGNKDWAAAFFSFGTGIATAALRKKTSNLPNRLRSNNHYHHLSQLIIAYKRLSQHIKEINH